QDHASIRSFLRLPCFQPIPSPVHLDRQKRAQDRQSVAWELSQKRPATLVGPASKASILVERKRKYLWPVPLPCDREVDRAMGRTLEQFPGVLSRRRNRRDMYWGRHNLR